MRVCVCACVCAVILKGIQVGSLFLTSLLPTFDNSPLSGNRWRHLEGIPISGRWKLITSFPENTEYNRDWRQVIPCILEKSAKSLHKEDSEVCVCWQKSKLVRDHLSFD